MNPVIDPNPAILMPTEPLLPMTTEAEVIRSAGRRFAQFPVQTPCGRPALRAFVLTDEDVLRHHLRDCQDVVIEILNPREKGCRVIKRAPLVPATAGPRDRATE